ncbi:MAG: hypothetical protein U9Q20_08730 [Campylobacterota bacterium]|nr:hypothetical protein [Campylobacterota bacterium]
MKKTNLKILKNLNLLIIEDDKEINENLKTMTSIFFKDVYTALDGAAALDVKPIEKVFDPLFTTKELKGSGLGLNMVQMFVHEQLNGDIKLQNYQDGIKLEIKGTI